MNQEIQQIKDKTDIVGLISQYTPLKKSGRNYKGLCPFHGEKTPSFMVSPELQIFKCFGCFPKGSLIKTAAGLHPIEALRVGDIVISGKGKPRKILQTHIRPYRGNLVEVVTAMLGMPVTLTEDHQVFSLGQGYSRKYKYLSKRLKVYKKLSDDEQQNKISKYFPIKKLSAGNLEKGDNLLYPINNDVKDIPVFDLSSYYDKILPKHGTKPKKINLIVPVEKDFLELIGWYLAEGSTHRAYVRFSFGPQEKKEAYEVYGIVKRLFGLKAAFHYRKGPHSGLELAVCHSQLANIFGNLCGKGATNKHLPFEFQFLPPQKQAVLLRAYWRGDGSFSRRTSRNKFRRYSISTASRSLAEQLVDFLLRQGYFPSLYTRGAHQTSDGVNHQTSYHLSWPKSTGSQMYNLTFKDTDETRYWVLPVRSVKKSRFSGEVYNLNVDVDNSYVANTFAVANCGEGGDVFSFVMKREGMEFRETLEDLATKAGVKLKKFESGSPQDQRRDRLFSANDTAARFYHFLLTKHAAGKGALEYLKTERGLTEITIGKFQLGYAPNANSSLIEFLIKKDFSESEILEAGLALRSERNNSLYDRFRARVVFPLVDVRNRVVGFTGRLITDLPNAPKYLNSPETPIYSKSRFLFGLNLARPSIKKAGRAVLVEGQMDLITNVQRGCENMVATSGTAVTPEQLEMLAKLCKEIVFAFDSDPAGQKALERGVEICENLGLVSLVALLPQGAKDPDEAVRKFGSEWHQALENPISFYDYYFDLYVKKIAHSDSLGKRNSTEKFLPLLAKMVDPLAKADYVKKLAQALDLDDKNVTEALVKIEKKDREKGRPGEKTTTWKYLEALPGLERIEVLRRYLLCLALRFDFDLVKTSLAKIPQKDFDSSSLSPIFLRLKGVFAKGSGPFEIKSLRSGLEGPSLNTFDELLLLDLGDLEADLNLQEKELDVVTKELKREILKAEVKELLTKIREAEESGKQNELLGFQEKLNTLYQKLKP